jgi:hypothetical protein
MYVLGEIVTKTIGMLFNVTTAKVNSRIAFLIMMLFFWFGVRHYYSLFLWWCMTTMLLSVMQHQTREKCREKACCLPDGAKARIQSRGARR